MGIFGNREKSFKADIEKQMDDIRKLATNGANVCVIGDYNLSFSDNYYYTKYGRDLVNKTFDECNIEILTRNKKECIDHIAITKNFLRDTNPSINEWNYEKTLSDHKGIVAEI